MKTTALRFSPLALAAIMALAAPVASQAQSAATDPVGYYTVTLKGGADNVISLPMMRDAVFAGTVATGGVQAQGFVATAGPNPPGWTASQYKYVAGSQRLTYYAELTSGVLKGEIYRIQDNDATTLFLDTEGVTFPTSAPFTLAAGDSFKIRPYWNIADVFESGGAPILKPRANAFDTTADEILFPLYSNPSVPGSTGINKAAGLNIYYLSGAGGGWQSVSVGGSLADQIIRPNEAIVVRRRGATDVPLTNLGGVLMNRSIYFFGGGNGTVGNDTYFSIARPAEVSLNDSGLRIANQASSPLEDTPNVFGAGQYDMVLAFDDAITGSGFNKAPTHSYYFLAGAGGGWRDLNGGSTDVGATVKLTPGKAYILRKRSASGNRDWSNDPNY